MENISLVMPAYNDSQRISRTLSITADYLSKHFKRFEIIVVDDGSTDRTAQVVREKAGDSHQIILIPQEKNLGKGAAIRRGMLSAKYEMTAQTDSDLPYDLSFLQSAREQLDAGADLAIGARDLKESASNVGYPWYRRFTAWGFSTFVAPGLVRGIRDTQCGIKSFKRKAARSLYALSTIRGFAFDVEVLFLAQQLGLKIRRLPVKLTHSSVSSVRLIRDSYAMWQEARRIAKHIRAGWYEDLLWDGEQDRFCRLCSGDLANAKTLDSFSGRRLVSCCYCGWATSLPLPTKDHSFLTTDSCPNAPEIPSGILKSLLPQEQMTELSVMTIIPAGYSLPPGVEDSCSRLCVCEVPLKSTADQLASLCESVANHPGFDRVIVYGILDWIIDMRCFCEQVKDALQPKGKLLLLAQNMLTPSAKLLRKTPQVNYVSPRTIRCLLERTGFDIIGIRERALWFGVEAKLREG